MKHDVPGAVVVLEMSSRLLFAAQAEKAHKESW